ncbi:MAG: TlpA family protein disulfide reductase [Methylobacteriaceae bacterium]|nr:TlpA family protein disulfide reductase [Methylobacteriaceae bacterium]
MRNAFALFAAYVLAIGMACAEVGDIAPFTRGTFAQIRAEHASRPLVLHFWSLTCPPCITEMPRLAAFARAHRDFDLVLVTTDPIEQSERVAARLKTWGLTDAANFAYADNFVERLRFEVDRNWHGELPFTALIKPDGSVKTVEGELKTEDLVAWLDKGLTQ